MTAYYSTTGSGYLNNPVRTIIIDRDNRPGSYPTHTSPVDQGRSSEFTSPFKDDTSIATPVVYSRARVVLKDVPREGAEINLVNAAGTTQKFVFKNIAVANTVSNVYNVDISGVKTNLKSENFPGLTPKQISITLASSRFIDTVNAATGSLISARPGKVIGEVLLEQKVPGTVGNQTNSTTYPVQILVENFRGGSNSSVRYPYGYQIVDGNPALPTNEIARRVLRGVKSGTLDVPTSGRATRFEAPSNGHPYAAYAPYDETGAYQAFGIENGGSDTYGTRVGLNEEFFTRGSISGSLDEPLRVKDKIVIDLTPVESTTIKSKNTVDDNYHMMYFNHETRKWERLGFGEYYLKGTPTFQKFLDRGYIGFGQFYNNVANTLSDPTYTTYFNDPYAQSEYEKIIDAGLASQKKNFIETTFGAAIDTFGFPLHPKFHATASQAYEVSQAIDRPFLVEKIVYEFSGSAQKGSLPGASFPIDNGTNRGWRTPAGVFFILNQRKADPDPGQEGAYTKAYISNRAGGFNLANTFTPPIRDGAPYTSPPNSFVHTYTHGGIPQYRVLSQGANPTYVDSVRDLVTFARIGCVWPTYQQEVVDTIIPGTSHPASVLDLAIEVPASGTFDGYYTVAANVKAPVSIPGSAFIILNTGSSAVPGGGPNIGSTNIISIYSSKDSSTRNSLDIPTGRSRTAEYAAAAVSSTTTFSGGGTNIWFHNLTKDTVDSPYLLLPGDKLIFGWQAPVSGRTAMNTSAAYEGYPLAIGPGRGKLTLYGSYLQEDKPVHDIFKDQLNSDAAHETIPSGPWVLDRFESEPGMVYAGSLRESHITGTMVTRNANGGLTVTSPSNLSIGGVRAVSAQVSSGNTGARWSLNRNYRIFDASEQYYDSMQPNPIPLLKTADPDVGLITLQNAPGNPYLNFIFLMIPGEVAGGGPLVVDLYTEMNKVASKNWIGSYPFERKYSGVSRVKEINRSTIANSPLSGSAIYYSGAQPKYPQLLNMGFGYLAGSAGITPAGTTGHSNMTAPMGLAKKGIVSLTFDSFLETTSEKLDTNPIWDNITTVFSTYTTYTGVGAPNADGALDQTDYLTGKKVNYHLSRMFGCFGSGYLGLVQLANFNPSYGTIRGQVYRGTKHGLINPTPLFSSAIFNGTRYGQLRDMMEQRQYTRFSLSDSSLSDAAVDVTFINRRITPDINGNVANNVTSGSATNSSNISRFATSEHPYDDALADLDLIWDRTSPLPEDALAL